jgi:hypothetical protein
VPDYTLLSATLDSTFTTANGQFNVYEVELQDSNGEKTLAKLNTKSSSPSPPAGPITGNLENTPYGWKFKKEFAPKPGGFGGGAPRNDPDTQAKIVRQHSQTVAVAIFVARGKTDFTFDEFEKLADALDRDVARGVERSKA